jgi:hypothetical protein
VGLVLVFGLPLARHAAGDDGEDGMSRHGRFEVLRNGEGDWVIFDPCRDKGAPVPTFKKRAEAIHAADVMALRHPGALDPDGPLPVLGQVPRKPRTDDTLLVRLRIDSRMGGKVQRERFARRMDKTLAREHVAEVNAGRYSPALVAWIDGEREPPGLYPEAPMTESAQKSYAVRCAECAAETLLEDATTGDRNPFLVHEPPCSFDDAVQAGRGDAWVREHGGVYPVTFYNFVP